MNILRSNLTIIDGHNYLFRAFFGVPEAAETKSGIQINAVYGFFAFLRQMAAAYPENKIFVVFDSETGTLDKLEEKEDYKFGRDIDAGMFKQLPYIKQILDLIGIKWVEHPKFEADDVIASLASAWNGDVYISSNDFDFVQIVSSKISLIRSSGGKLVDCDEKFIKTKFGIYPRQYADYLSMVGDKTDNIVGVKGIGPKTASDLLNRYNDLDGVFGRVMELPRGLQSKLLEGRGIIENNRRFISMKKDIPLGEIVASEISKVPNEKVHQKIAVHLKNIGL